jgi:hypothetical protein
MLEQADGPLTYLRFGIQRKKDFLRDVRDAYHGIVLTANILLYQYRSTPMLILGCRKPFFVDPISYLFGQPYEEFKQLVQQGGPRFKPSFDRLMKGHGLKPEEYLQFDYTKLLKSLLNSESNLADFTDKALAFQWHNVWSTVTDVTDYLPEEQLASLKEDDFRPRFLVPPYFLYLPSTDGRRSVTNQLNARILDYCWTSREQWGTDVFPAILLRKESLETDFIGTVVEDVTKHEFPGYCLWVEDFDERFATEGQISGLITLTAALSAGGRQVVMLYGGFFSMLLYYFGMTCVCHGLSYGEAKTLGAATQKGSGPAPVRYYILQLHRFLTLPDALIVLRKRPDLLCQCPICTRVLGGDPERVTQFNEEEELAEMHFLYNRDQERKMIAAATLAEAVEDLEWSLTLNNDIAEITKKFKTRVGFEERSIVNPTYLNEWMTALRNKIGPRA